MSNGELDSAWTDTRSLGVDTNGQENDGDKQHTAPGPQSLTSRASNTVIRALPLDQLATLPTLFPAPIAKVVTALATSARLSIKVSAWLIEAIIESLQYSTHASLGYTRRMLVTAISTARRVYLMSNAAAHGDMLGLMGFGEDKKVVGTDAYLSLLDRYTNLGIYVIHSTFTMAELFTMSGFYLTSNLVQSAHSAALESVALFDTIFGSNESSRALASIIALIRKEVFADERFELAGKGKIASLTALTKSLTAFSVLQSATWKRTSERLKMKVLYECTVVSKKDESSESRSSESNTVSPPSNKLEQAIAGPGPSTMAIMDRNSPPLHEVNERLLNHTDRMRQPSGQPDLDQAELEALRHFERLLADSDELHEVKMDDSTLRAKKLKRVREDVLEITDELSESTILSQMFDSSRGHTRKRSILDYDDLDPDSDVQITALDDDNVSHLIGGDEMEWIEVDQLLEGGPDSFPSVENGGSVAYREAFQHPSGNTDRLQTVLKSMTQKLMTRKRTIRRVRTETVTEDLEEKLHRPDVRAIEWASSQPSSPESQNTVKANSGMRMLKREHSDPPSSLTQSPPSRRPSIGQTMRSAFKPITSRVSRASSRATSPDRSGNMTPIRTPEPASGSVPPPPSPYVTKAAARTSNKGLPPVPSQSSTTKESVRVSDHRVRTESAQALPSRGDGSPDSLFPHDSLIKNIHRFMLFSSAAYGQNFLRILGLGNSKFNFPSTSRHHSNSWAFAHHTGIPIDSLLLSSYTESSATLIQKKAPPLVHYIAVDHALKAIILTCRGTLGLSDVLVDLTCDYRPISVDGGDPEGEYYVHSGMYFSALQLTVRQSTVHQTLIKALKDNPSYGLVMTGHSLGGGVAALLSIITAMPASTFLEENAILSKPYDHPAITTPFVTSISSGLPPGRPIHSFVYGVPAVTSIDLAKYSSGLITSVIQNSDVVPCLSLGVLRDLKNVAVTLAEEGNVAEEIVGRVVGLYSSKGKNSQESDQMEVSEEEELNDWMMSLIKTMRADMDNDKLFPPGMVYIMEHFDVFIPDPTPQITNGKKSISHNQAHKVILRQCDSVEERFREPLFSKTMLNDHLPSRYERSTRLLYEGLGQGKL